MATAKIKLKPNLFPASNAGLPNKPHLTKPYTTNSCFLNKTNDFVDVVNCLLTLIVDGRHINHHTGVSPNSWCSSHSSILIDKLMESLIGHQQKEMMAPSSSLSGQIQKSYNNSCLLNSIQCQIIEKLRSSLEKCCLNHLYKLKRQNNHVEFDDELFERIIDDEDHTLANSIDENEILTTAASATPKESNNIEECIQKLKKQQFEQLKSKSAPTSDLTTRIFIKVLLLPECCYENLNGDLLILNEIEDEKISYDLLEMWQIEIITSSNKVEPISNNNNSNCSQLNSKYLLNLNQIFQAIKSYLHFSQISSWLSQTKGQEPKHIAFSLSTSDPIDSNKYSNFDYHSFPSLNLLFENNRFFVSTNSNDSNNNKNVNSNSLVTTNLFKISLYSKKRSNQNICYLAPIIDCNKIHHALKATMPMPIYHNNASISKPSSLLLLQTTTSNILFNNTPPATPTNLTNVNSTNLYDSININIQSQSPKVLVSEHKFLLPSLQKEDDYKNNGQTAANCKLITTSPTDNNARISLFKKSIQEKNSKRTNINSNTNNKNLSVFRLSSSPAPNLTKNRSVFDFDVSLNTPKSIKQALTKTSNDEINNNDCKQMDYERLSSSKRRLNNMALLGSFEESLLNGRMNPVGVVDGFYAEIGASGSFFPEHVHLPVHAAFYQVCEDIAASPYLGVINLSSISRSNSNNAKRGYRVPNKGTIQVTLFNPNNTVVKMFVVMYDLSDMPANHRTFIRQRTMYLPVNSTNSNLSTSSANLNDQEKEEEEEEEEEAGRGHLKSFLRYLIHLRFATTKSGKLYLHTNIKLIFARNKSEIDPRLGQYEYKTFTESPKNPRYSLKK